jgi:enoyl-CoA hydratase/carnithine racemase
MSNAETLEEDLRFAVDDGVAVITINRPATLNAFTRPMIDRLRTLTDSAQRNPEVFGVVITGTGKAFCSGLDVTLLAKAAESQGAEARRPDGELPGLFVHLLNVSKPVIAAVNGVAAVGGFVLAMMCDLRFAADSASLTMAMSNRGLIAEHGTSWLLPRQIGISRALDLMWSSRRIGAAEALSMGLVDRVLSAGNELDAAKDYLRDLRARVSPRAVAEMKAQVYAHLDCNFGVAVEDSMRRMMEALKHPDIREGARAFIERRPPRFAPWTGS